ncbi:MAG: putative N-acyltransferase [Flavobacteriales bacterium]|jgi:predicted N-acyltransferase
MMKSWDVFSKTNQTDLRSTFYDSVALINQEHWNTVVGSNNIYLSLNYLQAIEESLKELSSFKYVLFHNEALEPVAAAYFQILNFVDTGKKYGDELGKLGEHVKHKILGNIDLKVMICGNAFSCGENGFVYLDTISPKEAFGNLSNAIFKLRRSETIDGKVSIVLLKEFWPETFEKSDGLKQNGFRDFKIDVNMVLDIHHSWKSTDDYLTSLTSKYRTKAKQVYKKSEALVIEKLGVDAINTHAKEIEELYTNVLNKADFKFGELNAKAFCLLKKHLGDNFIFRGYFLENKLIGFSTAYYYNNILDANYVGINYDYNQSYALYQRMLYDHVEEAIDKQVTVLRLGRTAELIKSSLGAKPVDMKLYIKHTNVISNQLIKPVIDAISPSAFELRQPFKAEFT